MATGNVALSLVQAVWFTAQPGTEGLAFGNTDLWQGLGIMLDSFDNNGLVSSVGMATS